MIPPLRRVTRRRADRSEVLECGHEHPGAYRRAQRRRCGECLVVADETPQVAEVSSIVEVEPNEVESGPRCSYCLDSRGEMQSCSGCQTLLHADCRRELRRCPTIGCCGGGSTTMILAEPRRIVIRRPTNSLGRILVVFLAAITWCLALPRRWFPKPSPFEPLSRDPS